MELNFSNGKKCEVCKKVEAQVIFIDHAFCKKCFLYYINNFSTSYLFSSSKSSKHSSFSSSYKTGFIFKDTITNIF